ncbi:MAG: hypothetical protein Kow002_05870 [Anaerolineales bacterium]
MQMSVREKDICVIKVTSCHLFCISTILTSVILLLLTKQPMTKHTMDREQSLLLFSQKYMDMCIFEKETE